MSHHIGDASVSEAWSRVSNDLIHRLTRLYPKNFAGVCQPPQSPGVEPKHCIGELVRCVEELGFVGCNLNPDPSGGYWTDPPLTDRWWYALYEKLVELVKTLSINMPASRIAGDPFSDIPALRRPSKSPRKMRQQPSTRRIILARSKLTLD
jgi:4-oxalmesaconate hydratase